jgi:hypothetical protein
MGHGSYLNVFAISPEAGEAGRIHIGDVVRTSANHYPHFSVIAINGEKVWVRNVETGQDSLTMLARCRRVEDQIAAIAAE